MNTMKKMRRLLALVMACAMLFALAACGGGDTTGTHNGTTDGDATEEANENQSNESTGAPSDSTGNVAFKIGGIGPLTGGAAIYGNAAKNGAQIAVDEINALGGIQLELKYEDDENDAEKAVNAYNSLKQWGMQISLGNVTTTPAIALSTDLYADRIFALTPSASAVEVTDGKDNVFQMCFADPNQGSASAQYISDKALGNKIAVIYQNDSAYSAGIYETFVTAANELGLEIVSATTFTEDSQKDFSVQIADAQNKGADLVFLPIYYTPASLILQQAKSANYEATFFGVDGMDGILSMEGFDTTLAEGVMLLTPFNADATDERTVNFVTTYQNQFGETPNQFAADAYDCIYAIYEAITNDGTLTAENSAEELNDALIAQFTSMTFSGLTGDDVTWDTSGQVTKAPKGMVIENGVYVGMD